MPTPALLRKLAFPGLLLCAACDDNSTTSPATPARLTILEGNDAVTSAGAELTLSVRAEDSDGQPVPGAAVAWTVELQGDFVDSPGTVSARETLADARGVATVKRFLGPTAGRYYTKAELFAVPRSTVHFSAAAQVQGAFSIGFAPGVSGNNQIDTVLATIAPYRVYVRDFRDLPVAGVRVRWVIQIGGGALTSDSSITNSAGIAEVIHQLGRTATFTQVDATVDGLIGSPVRFGGQAQPGNVTALSKLAGDGQIGVSGVQLENDYVVSTTDSYGNPAGTNLVWTITSGGGSIRTTGSNRVRHTLGSAEGPQTVSVRAPVGPAIATFTSTAYSAFVYVVTDYYYGRLFSPWAVTIAPGRTVVWSWQGGCFYFCIAEEHNIVFEDAPTPPASSPNRRDGYHLRTFVAPGVYRYRCTNHSKDFDDASGMVGVVNVQ